MKNQTPAQFLKMIRSTNKVQSKFFVCDVSGALWVTETHWAAKVTEGFKNVLIAVLAESNLTVVPGHYIVGRTVTFNDQEPPNLSALIPKNVDGTVLLNARTIKSSNVLAHLSNDVLLRVYDQDGADQDNPTGLDDRYMAQVEQWFGEDPLLMQAKDSPLKPVQVLSGDDLVALVMPSRF